MDMDLQYTKDSVDKIIERAIDFRMLVRLKDGVPEVLEEVSRDAPIGGGGIANNLNYAVRGTVVVVAVVIVAAAVVGAATYSNRRRRCMDIRSCLVELLHIIAVENCVLPESNVTVCRIRKIKSCIYRHPTKPHIFSFRYCGWVSLLRTGEDAIFVRLVIAKCITCPYNMIKVARA